MLIQAEFDNAVAGHASLTIMQVCYNYFGLPSLRLLLNSVDYVHVAKLSNLPPIKVK